MDDYEVQCDTCGWCGLVNDLAGVSPDDRCPECGSGDIVDYGGEE